VSPSEAEPPRAEAEFVSPTLEGRMATVAAAIEQRGFAGADEPLRAFLVERSSSVRTVSLPVDRCQVFVALGSSALQAIELGVFESGGTEVASARGTSSVALRYCPTLPGVHYVAVQARAGDGLIVARRFEGPGGIELELEDLFTPTAPAAAEAIAP
jgi:hypothetical protein